MENSIVWKIESLNISKNLIIYEIYVLTREMVQYLVSATVLPTAVGKSFTDYKAIPEAFKELDVSGLEFTFLPEWSSDRPPLGRTAADWESCPKPSFKELTDILEDIPTPTVHLNRDVGDMLCSEDETMIERGKIL